MRHAALTGCSIAVRHTHSLRSPAAGAVTESLRPAS